MREWHARDEAWQRARSFARRFGEPHVRLAMHGAVPIGLTPELLRLIRVNFVAAAPWVAEADLLLSPICRDVGGGFYEMDEEVRGLLVEELQRDPDFGPGRLQAVADFLGAWADRVRESAHDPEWRDFVEGQALTALSYRKPEEAAEALARSLNSPQRGRAGVDARVIKLTQGLSSALMSQVEVVTYAVALDKLAAGDFEAALEHFGALGPMDQPVKIGNVELPAPAEWGVTERQVEGEEGEAAEGEDTLDADIELIGDSPAMRNVREVIAQAAASKTSVLILGEAGTGKEFAARAVHRASARSDKPFIVLNCAVTPETLLGSELFGNAVTAGSAAPRKGKLEKALGGTLFLDEIDELPMEWQTKLVDVSLENELTRVDGAWVPLDVRILAATNRDLHALMAEGRFLEALYAQLNALRIYMPPLRERREDIPVLAEYFLASLCRKHKSPLMEISPEVRERLLRYDWPGNVRQLMNVIERLVLLGGSNAIALDDLPAVIRDARRTGRRVLLAYSSLGAGDWQAGEKIGEFLRSEGHTVFDVAQDLATSSGITHSILTRMRASDAVIVVCGAEAANSEWLRNMVDLARRTNVTLLPVAVTTMRSGVLTDIAGLDTIRWDEGAPEGALRSLNAALNLRVPAAPQLAGTEPTDELYIETEAAREARRLILSGSSLIVRGARRSGKTALLRYLERVLGEENVATRYIDKGPIPYLPGVCLVDNVDDLKEALDSISRQKPTRWVVAAPAGSGPGELDVRAPIVELQDFTLEETAELNRRLGSPLGVKEIQELFDLIDGHPYLTRAVITGVAGGQPFTTMIASGHYPFAEDLETLEPELETGGLWHAWIDLLSGSQGDKYAEDAFLALGLGKRSDGKLVPRNRLYRESIHTPSEIVAAWQMQRDLRSAEGLLLIGGTEQALTFLKELEAKNPVSPELVALRQRVEAQRAEESLRARISQGVTECKDLVRNQQFDEAVAKATQLLADFPDNTELKELLRHATERLAAKERAEQNE